MLQPQDFANATHVGKPGKITSSLGMCGFISHLLILLWMPERVASNIDLSSSRVFLRVVIEFFMYGLCEGSGGCIQQINWDVECQVCSFCQCLDESDKEWHSGSSQRGGWVGCNGRGTWGRQSEAKSGCFIKRSVKPNRAGSFYKQS